MSTVYGGDNDDVIGTPASNSRTIYADDGDDTINTHNLSQLVYGGDGNDTINGHGDYNTQDVDRFFGGAGDDYITSGFVGSSAASGDRLDGDDGADQIYGGTARDTLTGGAGEDSVYGGDGADTVYGDFATTGLTSAQSKFHYEYFELDGTAPTNLADAGFDDNVHTRQPDGEGTIDTLDVGAIASAHDDDTNEFAVRLTTTLTVSAGGTYDFSLSSDDGSALYINGTEVVN